MIGAEDLGRVRRLKFWIAVLTILPGVSLLAAGSTRAAFGYTTGGAVMFLNLLGTERSVQAFLGDRQKGWFLVPVLYSAKLVLTAAVIAAVLINDLVPPIALLFGITTFVVALMFDFLFFPRNIKDGEEL